MVVKRLPQCDMDNSQLAPLIATSLAHSHRGHLEAGVGIASQNIRRSSFEDDARQPEQSSMSSSQTAAKGLGGVAQTGHTHSDENYASMSKADDLEKEGVQASSAAAPTQPRPSPQLVETETAPSSLGNFSHLTLDGRPSVDSSLRDHSTGQTQGGVSPIHAAAASPNGQQPAAAGAVYSAGQQRHPLGHPNFTEDEPWPPALPTQPSSNGGLNGQSNSVLQTGDIDWTDDAIWDSNASPKPLISSHQNALDGGEPRQHAEQEDKWWLEGSEFQNTVSSGPQLAHNGAQASHNVLDAPVEPVLPKNQDISSQPQGFPSTSNVEQRPAAVSQQATAESSCTNERSETQPAVQNAAKTETYQIKHINWMDGYSNDLRHSSVLVQNVNGPCPLVALVNALSLSIPANSQSGLREVLRVREHISLGLLLDAVLDELFSSNAGSSAPDLPDVGDLYQFLKTLHTGMNVNPQFVQPMQPPNLMDSPVDSSGEPTSALPLPDADSKPGSFEETKGMQLYGTFSIPLVHGWLPGPDHPAYTALRRSAPTYEDAQNLLFREEELEEKLLHGGGLTEDEQQLLQDIGAIKYFLDASATQLTRHGLDTLTQALPPGSLSILFRNDHFSTIYKHPSSFQLLQLVTDAGYAGHDEIVWESLVDVTGKGSEFFAGDFRPVGHHAAVTAAANAAGHLRGRGGDGGGVQSYSHDHRNGGNANEQGWVTVGDRSGGRHGRVASHRQAGAAAGTPASLLDIGLDSGTNSGSGGVSLTTAVSPSEQEDHDLALALQLQEEEDDRQRLRYAQQLQQRQQRQGNSQFQEVLSPAPPRGNQAAAVASANLAGGRGAVNSGNGGPRRVNIPITQEIRPLVPPLRPMVVPPMPVARAAPPAAAAAGLSTGGSAPMLATAPTPPGNNNASNTGNTRAVTNDGDEDGDEAPPPSYEQAARTSPYNPPPDHPAHSPTPATADGARRQQQQQPPPLLPPHLSAAGISAGPSSAGAEAAGGGGSRAGGATNAERGAGRRRRTTVGSGSARAQLPQSASGPPPAGAGSSFASTTSAAAVAAAGLSPLGSAGLVGRSPGGGGGAFVLPHGSRGNSHHGATASGSNGSGGNGSKKECVVM